MGPLVDAGLRDALLYARSQPHVVTADELAAAQGIHRNVARSRLERLARAGLLIAGFERRSGRSGPGGGGRRRRRGRAYHHADVSVAPAGARQRMRGSPRPGPVGGVDRSTPERAGRRRLRAVRLSTFERAVFGTSSLSKYTRSVLTPA